jgi:hypothetical protein
MWTLFLTLKQTKDSKMITVQEPISPKTTELKAVITRLEMRENAKAKTVRELRAKKLAGQHNINDRESRIAMVMAEESFPATDDTDAKLTSELLEWEAIVEAKESVKPKLAAARREASDKILAGLKPAHDEIMHRLVSALVEAHKANVELFDLRSQLRDRSIGWRNGVCELLPDEVLNTPTIYSHLADFFRAAVKAGYLKTLPAGFIK